LWRPLTEYGKLTQPDVRAFHECGCSRKLWQECYKKLFIFATFDQEK
jgi:hypothetical protein